MLTGMNNYDRIAEEFDRGRSLSPSLKRYVDLAIDGLAAGARVLDLGCGTGRPIGEYLASRGLAITGVDESAEMLRRARAVIPGAELVLGEMTKVEFAEPFDAIIAWDSLFHVDRRDHLAIYDKFARWLRPTGGLLLSSGGSASEGFMSKMFGHDFFYSSHEPSRVQQELKRRGFEILCSELDDPSGNGHQAIVARKKDRGTFRGASA